MKNRKARLQKIAQEALDNQQANDAVDDINDLRIEDDQEYAHRIFLHLLHNLKIKGLDD